jgi:hypothetical protein
MNPLLIVSGKLKAWRSKHARRQLRKSFSGGLSEISRSDWPQSLADPTAFYVRCCHFFDHHLPAEFRRHREYFTQNRRGFGEDAFHAMWFLLFREFKPENFLEIGVLRGQSLSLAALLARYFKLNCFVQGISPFSPAGDTVSTYRNNVNCYDDTLKNFSHFDLPAPALLRAYSTDIEAARLIASRPWHFIYIDGNHDYEIARQGWDLCARNLLLRNSVETGKRVFVGKSANWGGDQGNTKRPDVIAHFFTRPQRFQDFDPEAGCDVKVGFCEPQSLDRGRSHPRRDATSNAVVGRRAKPLNGFSEHHWQAG